MSEPRLRAAAAGGRAFYTARGGACVERVPVSSPAGGPAMFVGQPYGLRMAWPDPATRLA